MSLTLNINHGDAAKIADCIKGIAGNVTDDDIVEIVLKTPQKGEPAKKGGKEILMSSREVADALGRPHSVVFKQIAKYLCEKKIDGPAEGFYLSSFVCSHRNRKTYPMYEMTERACESYKKLVEEYGAGYRSVKEGVKRLDRAMQEQFRSPVRRALGNTVTSDFLLEGKPRSEYEAYCNMFDQFITGPALMGREISELTQGYQNFRDVLESVDLDNKDYNRIDGAMSDVAIEAEMQGFIYGFKIFDELLNQRLATA